MPPKILRRVLGSALLLLLVCTGILLTFRVLLLVPHVQHFLVARLSDALGYELKAERLWFSLGRDIEIRAYGFEAASPSGKERLRVASLGLALDLSDLIQGRVSSARVVLTHPRLDLGWEVGGREGGIEQGLPPLDAFLGALAGFDYAFVENGEVRTQGLARGLRQLTLSMVREAGEPERISLRMAGRAGLENVPFHLQATVNAEAVHWRHLLMEGLFQTGPVPLRWIPETESLRFARGDAALNLRIEGDMHGRLVLKGRVEGKAARFFLNDEGREKAYSLSRFSAGFSGRMKDRIFETDFFDLRAPGLALTGRLRIDGRDGQSPDLELTAGSASMSLQTFKAYYPAPLLAEWIETELLPDLDRGEVRLERLWLKGTAEQLSHLGRRENAGCLEVKMAWEGLQLQDQKDAAPIQGLSGELRYANGSLRVEGGEATLGRSLIRRHTLDIGGIYEDKVWCDVLVDGRFDLGDLACQAVSPRVEPEIRKQVDRIRSVSGTMEATARVRYEEGRERLSIQGGRFRLRTSYLQHVSLRLPLVVDDAEVEIGDGGSSVSFEGQGKWGRSSFRVTGEAQDLGEVLRAKIEMTSDLQEILETLLDREDLPFLWGDPGPARISLFRGPDRWSIDGEARIQGAEFRAGEFGFRSPGDHDRIEFGFDLYPQGRIEVRKAVLVLKDSLIEAKGLFAGEDPQGYEFSLSSRGLGLEDLEISYKKEGLQAAGTVDFRAEVRGQRGGSLEPHIQGEISARGVSLSDESLPFPISEGEIRAEVSRDRWKIPFLRAKLGGSVIEMDGDLKVAEGLEGHVTLNVPFLDFQELLAGRQGVFEGQGDWIERWSGLSNLRVKLKVYQGRLKRLLFTPIEAEGLFGDNALRLTTLTARTEHGALKARGGMTFGEGASVRFTSALRFEGQPIGDVLDALGIRSPDMRGPMTLEAVLFSSAEDIKSLLRNLHGGGTVMVNQGAFRESRVLFKILELLSLQNIYKVPGPGVSKGEFYFDKVGGRFTIKEGVLESDSLTISSPAFNAYGKGTVDIAGRTMDFDLGVQPIGTVDFLVSKIPIVGYILTGKKGTLLLYYFTAKGPIDAPEVSYVPLKNWGKGTVGMLERLLLTPRRLLERLSKIGEGIDPKDLPEISEEDIGP